MALRPSNSKDLADQALKILTNARRNIRTECSEWRQRVITNGDRPAIMAAYALRDVGTRIVGFLDTIAANQVSVVEALGIYNMTQSDLTAEYTAVRSAAEALRDINLDGSTFNTVTSQILSGLAADVSLF